MSLSINNNTAAMAALQSLNQTTADLTKTENTVSTGKSVNTASDNPAMYSIAQNMTAQISTLSGVSTGLAFSAQVLNTATTGLSSISTALQSLATTIGTNTTGVDNSTLNEAITKTLASIDSAASGAKFQGVNLLSGQTGNGTTYTSLSTAMDAQGSTFTQNGFNVTSAGLGLTNLSMEMSGSSLALGSSTTSNTFATNNVIKMQNTAAAGTGGTVSAANPSITYNFIANTTGNDSQTSALGQVATAIGTTTGDLTVGADGLLKSSSNSILSHTTASDGSVTYALGNGDSIVQSKDGNGNAVYTANTAFDSNGNVTTKSVITDVKMASTASLSTQGGSTSAQSVQQVALMTQAMEYQGFGVSRDSSNNLTIAGNSISATSTQMGTVSAQGATISLGNSSATAFATNNVIQIGNGVSTGTADAPKITSDFIANTTGSTDTTAVDTIGKTAGLSNLSLNSTTGALTTTDTTYTLSAGTTQADGSTLYSLTTTSGGTASGTISQSTDTLGNAVYTFTSADSTAKTVVTNIDMSDTTSLSAVGGTSSAQSTAQVKSMENTLNANGYGVALDSKNNLTISGSAVDYSSTSIGKITSGAYNSGTPSSNDTTISMFAQGVASKANGFTGAATAVTGASVVSAVVQAAISSVTRTASSIGYSSTTISNLQTTTSSLSDALTTGVGALTDADLAAESAKLTSLQTKQQLAVQALSIANSQSSTLLSLFRG